MKKAILLVDDDPCRRALLGGVLERSGYAVVLGGHRREAARCLKAAECDLLLLDLDLAGGSGFDVLDVAARHPEVPVVVLTEQLGQCDRGALIGADAVVEKPTDAELLLGTLEMLFGEPTDKRNERRARGSGGIRFVSALRRNGAAAAQLDARREQVSLVAGK